MFTTPGSPYPPVLPAGRITLTSEDQLIRVVLDSGAEEWWVECSPMAQPSDIETYLDQMIFRLGFELLDDEECEAERQPDGFLRIYCAPIATTSDLDHEADAIITPLEVGHRDRRHHHAAA